MLWVWFPKISAALKSHFVVALFHLQGIYHGSFASCAHLVLVSASSHESSLFCATWSRQTLLSLLAAHVLFCHVQQFDSTGMPLHSVELFIMVQFSPLAFI